MVRMSVPDWSSWVANEWRSVWQPAFLGMSASRMASLTSGRRRTVPVAADQASLALGTLVALACGDHLFRLCRDHLGVLSHHLIAQRLVPERLPALFGCRVEYHATAEDGGHEGIGGRLVELFFGRAKEGPLRLFAVEHHDAVVGQPHFSDLAALVVHALHQLDGRTPQRQQVPE